MFYTFYGFYTPSENWDLWCPGETTWFQSFKEKCYIKDSVGTPAAYQEFIMKYKLHKKQEITVNMGKELTQCIYFFVLMWSYEYLLHLWKLQFLSIKQFLIVELLLPKSNPPTHVKFSKHSVYITIQEAAKHLQGVHQLSCNRKISLFFFFFI